MADEFSNPVADGAFEVEPKPNRDPSEGTSVAGMINLVEHGLSEDELTDLTYAFQAADTGGDGTLSLEEFHWMLEVMGCGLNEQQTQKLAKEAKANFATWLKTADDSHMEECRKAWDVFDSNHDGKMDLDELNEVIKHLRAQGFNPKPLAKADLADGAMDFDEFSTWFIAQESGKKFKMPKKAKTKLSKESTEKCARRLSLRLSLFALPSCLDPMLT
eukprot:COSAG02_NODE_2978_length_7629_cov_3.880478_7_plen_217_part_00